MQKNYRNFTVGELMDMGLNVSVSKHHLESIDEGKQIARQFEGTKQSTRQITGTLKTVKAWKENFEATFYL